jgi:proteasome lid subunit RPN8/RPN11
MNVVFKAPRALLEYIRADLRRTHTFAAERVGFLSAGMTRARGAVLVLAQSYRPVDDGDYLHDQTVGAMMGPDAIRKAMQWAITDKVGIFHVHTHGGAGLPGFSDIDLREQANYMPSFLNAASQHIHGAIVLSQDSARGQVWLSPAGTQTFIFEFIDIGAPLRKWRGL